MSMREIERKFDQEWVLIEDPVTTKTLEIKSGKVGFHHKDRDELYKLAKSTESNAMHYASLYVGALPDELFVFWQNELPNCQERSCT